MADVKPDPIFQVASGFLAAKHLFVAVEIGLFEKLAQGPATLEEMSQRTGIPLRTLRILLPTPWLLSALSNGRASDTAMVLLQPLSLLAQFSLIFARSCAFGTASVISDMQGSKTPFAVMR